MIEAALRQGVAGLVVDGSVKAEPNGRLIGLPVRERALQQVRQLRQLVGTHVPIISSGGVHEPAHALELLSGGADLVQVDTGFIYTGPGLPKRINDCLLFDAARQPSSTDSTQNRRAHLVLDHTHGRGNDDWRSARAGYRRHESCPALR